MAPSIKTVVEFFGKQLDPTFEYEPYSLSPGRYFAQYSARDYIRIVIIVGTYVLLIRPLFEKGMQRLKDRDARRNQGPKPVPIDLPPWQTQPGVDGDGDGLDWSSKVRRRAKEKQERLEKEQEEREAHDEDLDKYLD